jgi:hypothetical protein
MTKQQQVQNAHAIATVAILEAMPDLSIDQAGKIVESIATLVFETLRANLDGEE